MSRAPRRSKGLEYAPLSLSKGPRVRPPELVEGASSTPPELVEGPRRGRLLPAPRSTSTPRSTLHQYAPLSLSKGPRVRPPELVEGAPSTPPELVEGAPSTPPELVEGPRRGRLSPAPSSTSTPTGRDRSVFDAPRRSGRSRCPCNRIGASVRSTRETAERESRRIGAVEARVKLARQSCLVFSLTSSSRAVSRCRRQEPGQNLVSLDTGSARPRHRPSGRGPNDVPAVRTS